MGLTSLEVVSNIIAGKYPALAQLQRWYDEKTNLARQSESLTRDLSYLTCGPGRSPFDSPSMPGDPRGAAIARIKAEIAAMYDQEKELDINIDHLKAAGTALAGQMSEQQKVIGGDINTTFRNSYGAA